LSSSGDAVLITLELPPSVNKLYVKRRGGGQALSAEAVRFNERVKQTVQENLHRLNHLRFTEDTVLGLDLFLYFGALENPGWFEQWEKDSKYTKDILFKKGPRKGQVQHRKGEFRHRAGERKAKTKYKTIDYDNRIKFLQDAVAKTIGIPDDSQIFGGFHCKLEDPNNPRAEVIVRVSERDLYFPTEAP